MIYAAIILLIGAVITCHFHDWKDARNGHTNHSRNLKWKILSCTPAGIFFLINLTGWQSLMEWMTLWESVKSILLTATWFMFLFNELWGIKVSGDPFYRSTAVGKNLSWFDRQVLHWPKGLYILFMGCLVTGATLIYFL